MTAQEFIKSNAEFVEQPGPWRVTTARGSVIDAHAIRWTDGALQSVDLFTPDGRLPFDVASIKLIEVAQ